MIAIVLLGAGVALLAVAGRSRWDVGTRELMARLEAAREAPYAGGADPHPADPVPLPVQRFFMAVLPERARIVTAATVTHSGTFNLSETGEQWRSFTSTQRVTTRRPGFVWDGRVAMLPGFPWLSVHVHDAYVAGEGRLHPALLGLVTLADLRGDGDIARGELLRYLAESAWYPTALLPGHGVEWTAMDDRSARATLVDGAISVSMLFRFGADGLIESVRAENRGRTVGGKLVPTPWEGRWFDYRLHEGVLVPFSGEVAWLLPEGRQPYWRGTIESLAYEYAP